MGGWFGLGKKRSKLGTYLDRNNIDQEVVSKKSGIPNTTISNWCDGNKSIKPIRRNAVKVLRALKEITGKDFKYEDFWA